LALSPENSGRAVEKSSRMFVLLASPGQFRMESSACVEMGRPTNDTVEISPNLKVTPFHQKQFLGTKLLSALQQMFRAAPSTVHEKLKIFNELCTLLS